jgi:Protein of unknown function (DUF2934)
LTEEVFRRNFGAIRRLTMSPDATKKQPTTRTSELQELELEYQIRLRAYELYQECGREDGHELDDWLRAEAEITQKKVRTAAA